eukprot:m.80445 g.80445  ORF g.80445 m.80445 type:complete len:406 (-) comp17481_c0_seq8:25-1242(-)
MCPVFHSRGALRSFVSAAHASIYGQPALQEKLHHICDPLPFWCAFILQISLTPYAGSVMGHLFKIELMEHCVVRGLHREDAVQLFARGITDHIQTLQGQRLEDVVLGSVSLAEATWSIPEILGSSEDFRSDLHSAVQKQERVVITIFLFYQARYFQVQKQMALHFVPGPNVSSFIPSSTKLRIYHAVYRSLPDAREVISCLFGAGQDPLSYGRLEPVLKTVRDNTLSALQESDIWALNLNLLTHSTLLAQHELIPSLQRFLKSSMSSIMYLSSIVETMRTMLTTVLDLMSAGERQAAESLFNGIRVTAMYRDFTVELKELLETDRVLWSATFSSEVLTTFNFMWTDSTYSQLNFGEGSVDVLEETLENLKMLQRFCGANFYTIFPAVHKTVEVLQLRQNMTTAEL